MKKSLLLFLSGTLMVASAQELPMTFTALNAGSYNELTNPISVNNGEIWDDPEYVVPIGFPFQLFGSTMNEVAFLGVGALVGSISPEMSFNGLWVYGSDVTDIGNINFEVSLSPISYQVSGTSPNRIFILEWKNVGFYNEVFDNATAQNTVNFQLWLYETSNVIEYRFGPNTVTDPSMIHDFGFPYTGLIQNLNLIDGSVQGAWLLGGNPANPTPAVVNIATKQQPGPQHLLTGEPASGQVYRFAPIIPISVAEKAKANTFSVYPTQVNEQFNVRLDEGNNLPFTLRNLLGQEVMAGRLNSGLNTFNAAQLQPGMYLLTAGDTTVRLIKK